jgi:hypothetical protein
VEANDKHGKTALRRAVQNGHAEVAGLLLVIAAASVHDAGFVTLVATVSALHELVGHARRRAILVVLVAAGASDIGIALISPASPQKIKGGGGGVV